MGLDRICKGRAPGRAEGIVVMMVLLMMAGGAGATPHEGASFPRAPADLILHSRNASMPADFENYSMLSNYPDLNRFQIPTYIS